MKKIIRLTESELHNIIHHSVKRVLHEENNVLLLQFIAQYIIQKNVIEAKQGKNYLEVELQNGKIALVIYNVYSDPYIHKGMRSNSYDVPNDQDDIVDDFDIEVVEIRMFDYNGNEEEGTIQDNGIVAKALERVVQLDYSNGDIPSEDDYFDNY